jgi:microcystin-dependent protein
LISANSSVISRVHRVGEYDGEEWHKLTKDEIPSHTHTVNNVAQILSGLNLNLNNLQPANVGDINQPSIQTSSTGGSGYHNNVPPFYGLYFYMKVSDN